MDRPSNSPPVASTARRTIVRAGFAVPALATVASGSALATKSATCMIKAMSSPSFPIPSDSLDGYVRVRLGKFTSNAAVIKYYVDGSALAALPNIKRSSSYNLTSGNFQRFYIDTNLEKVNSIVSSTPSDGTYVKDGDKYAVLRFNASGEVVGVGKASPANNTSALAGSCWNSLHPKP